jgi:hypothetical protein
MKVQWFQDLPLDKRDQYKKSVLASKETLDKLCKILYNKIQELEMTSKSDYDNPSWPYYAADRIGYIRAMKEVISLCDLTPKER